LTLSLGGRGKGEGGFAKVILQRNSMRFVTGNGTQFARGFR
jgi:hypothetical protein